jgi:hypothetical protein
MSRLTQVILALAAFAAAFLLTPGSGPRTADRRTARSGAMEALEFWSGARAYPSADLSPDQYYRAFESAGKAALKQKPLPFTGSGWKYIGPANLAGRMLAIAINPQNPNTIYADNRCSASRRSRSTREIPT